MKKLEIEIPVDKEVDWEASAVQKQIVLKNKQLTYKDICKELFNEGYYFTDSDGSIRRINCGDPISNLCLNNASTRHQLECILAKNKLANVARYLNGDWKEHERNFLIEKYIIWHDETVNALSITAIRYYTEYAGNILFKSPELAKQAIEILGEETVKLALEPLY